MLHSSCVPVSRVNGPTVVHRGRVRNRTSKREVVRVSK